jgi:dTDP-glucose 4,6-dehydratase
VARGWLFILWNWSIAVRVLLAGGAGFIGSHLSDLLLARGHEVVVVDNLVTGRTSNIQHLSHHNNFTFVEHDVIFPLPSTGSFSSSFELVLNFASPASPNAFETLPIEILAVGSSGTRNLLDRALADNATFLLASTSEVYGDPLVHPQPETYWGNVSPVGPRSCYDEAKRFSEALTMAYHRKFGLRVQIARIFNTYGERMRPDDGRVVNTFVEQALRGEPLTIHGAGDQSRSFCYIADEAAGLLALIDSGYSQPVNIGNPLEITVRDLALEIINIAQSQSQIVHIPLPPEREGDPVQRRPDISLARSVLGWEPKVGLTEGLTEMIRYFRHVEGIG